MRNHHAPLSEKIQLAKETAESVAYVHQCKVLTCNIHVRNVLLDAELYIRLCDFQCWLLGHIGEVLLSGEASENAESFMPHGNIEFADVKANLFALGSNIYYTITGQRPLSQYNTIVDEATVEGLYRKGNYPSLDKRSGGEVVHNC